MLDKSITLWGRDLIVLHQELFFLMVFVNRLIGQLVSL